MYLSGKPASSVLFILLTDRPNTDTQLRDTFVDIFMKYNLTARYRYVELLNKSIS